MEDHYCPNHPKVLVTSGLRCCDKCMESKRQSSNRRTKRLKEEGLCIVCGKEKPEEGRLRCRQCIDKHLASQKEKKNKGEKDKKAPRPSENNGVRYCYKHPSTVITDGHKTCEKCRRQAREYARARKAREAQSGEVVEKKTTKKKRIIKDSSLCSMCGKYPHAKDRKFCELCLKDMRDKSAKAVAYRRAHHLCCKCGSSEFIMPEKNCCEDCLAVRRAKAKGIKQDKEAKCEECHNKKPLLGFPFCRKCLSELRLKAPERVLEYYSDEVLDNFMGWLRGEW